MHLVQRFCFEGYNQCTLCSDYAPPRNTAHCAAILSSLLQRVGSDNKFVIPETLLAPSICPFHNRCTGCSDYAPTALIHTPCAAIMPAPLCAAILLRIMRSRIAPACAVFLNHLYNLLLIRMQVQIEMQIQIQDTLGIQILSLLLIVIHDTRYKLRGTDTYTSTSTSTST